MSLLDAEGNPMPPRIMRLYTEAELQWRIAAFKEQVIEAIERWADDWKTRTAEGRYQDEILCFADVRRDESEEIARHLRLLLPADSSALAAHDERLLRKRVTQWREKYGGPWLDTDPIEDFKLLNEIQNEGFEEAHDLMPCGHSRGDYRDADYVRGKPETYTASEKCVGCASNKRLLEPFRKLEQELGEWIADHKKLQGHGDVCGACLAYGIVKHELGALLPKEGK